MLKNHSEVNLITNSSSELFVVLNEKTPVTKVAFDASIHVKVDDDWELTKEGKKFMKLYVEEAIEKSKEFLAPAMVEKFAAEMRNEKEWTRSYHDEACIYLGDGSFAGAVMCMMGLGENVEYNNY